MLWHVQTRRCQDTGSGGAGALAAAGRQGRARRSQADRGGQDLRGEPACGEQVGGDRQGRRAARLEAEAPGPPAWTGRAVARRSSAAHP